MVQKQAFMEIWTIDCDHLFEEFIFNFENYANFHWAFPDYTGNICGMAFGRPDRHEVVHVFFCVEDMLNQGTVEYITSALPADIVLVGNVSTGHSITLSGDQSISLQLNKEMLEGRDRSAFLEENGQFNHGIVSYSGMSLVTAVGFEVALRNGREADDLRHAVTRLRAASFRFVFINKELNVVLKEHDEKDARPNVLSELFTGKAEAFPHKNCVNFVTMQSLTRNTKDDKEDQKLVPTVKITRDGQQMYKMMCLFELVVPIRKEDSSFSVYSKIVETLKRRSVSLLYVNLSAIKSKKPIGPTLSATFLPKDWRSLLHVQIPQWSETDLNKSLGRLYLTKGPYDYHHYLQDNIDDSGWGCAYRSLQSIWSWYRLNGYTDEAVPSHRQIQQCLVDIGDKEEKFVGSRQWIGSTEIGFVLDSLLGVESKYIVTNSGSEVVERARELAVHFQITGTPVMIGNMLAHTILGVDWDESSGEVRFLVLDPHYTGSDHLQTVLTKGWCAWKPANFWNPATFYNLCLPQLPRDTI
ncbi:hypothetical protein WR25_03253 [Diploscapter pachys]|uniref:Ufm1-specific protease n=1 Tax=Diploscapter pachys TaxID=2018661 RepID=A0A2A2JQ74_9BILA|nr:hypothetical protein WR25_03253 [Diploscapter pachys]